MEEFKIEQLVVLTKEGGFCDSEKSFIKLLQSNSDISISGSKLIYKRDLDVQFSLICDEIKESNQRFFQISMSMSKNEDFLDLFVELHRTLKTIISKTGSIPETLRDDVSTYYAKKSYPLIHTIENLLRKLITSFMIRKVGSGYVKETSPEEFKVAIDNSKERGALGYMDAMYKVDFKHLADFLFKPYSKKNQKDLHNIIHNAKSIENLNLDDLKDYVPKSNWQRYFYQVVECEDSFLLTRWMDLYDLRCKIAHNTIINKSIFLEIERLTMEVEAVLKKAVEKLDAVAVPEDEQDTVAERAISYINEPLSNYLNIYNYLENCLFYLELTVRTKINPETDYRSNFETISSSSSKNTKNFKSILSILIQHRIIPKSLAREIEDIQIMRNNLVHMNSFIYSQVNILHLTKELQQCLSTLEQLTDGISERKVIVTIAIENTGISVQLVRIFLENYKFDDAEIDGLFKAETQIINLVSQEFLIPTENIVLVT